MADDPGAELNDAFRQLKRATGVPMKALAEGLLFRDDTGEAHLSRPDVARHLAELVDRAYLGDAAGRLGLGREGFAALRAFSGRVRAVVAPEYSERAPHCALGDALESAVIGDILADRQAWEPALEHLEDAWKFLGSRRLRASDRGFHEFVRAGTQIAVIRDYQGQHDDSSRVMCRVLRVISLTDASRLPPRTQKAVASAFRSASVAYRHQGKRPPAQIIRLCHHSFTRLASFPGLDTLGVAGALRDQVRPRLQMRLGFAPSGGLEPALSGDALDYLAAARAVLERAAASWATADLATTWLDTALAHACLRETDAAQRAWERAADLCAQFERPSEPGVGPLRTKQALIEMFLLAACGKWDALRTRHQRFREIVGPAYRERVARADELAAAAETEDWMLACRIALK